MKAWWQLFSEAFTPAECQGLIDYALTHPVQQGSIGHGGANKVNPNIRRSKVRWLGRQDAKLFPFYARIADMAERANNHAFGFDLRQFRELQFTEYDAGDEGHYGWHEDNAWKAGLEVERKMSMVIQLSDPADYEGGRLELQNDPLGPEQFTRRGDVLFFPAFNRHRVTPVTRGRRYSLVTWFTGPAFR
ncbi:2OG-Fe(II) oxygenase [Prosthecobacter dejongeii]|uniref:PKHD-type hydroxylase n=1 Tax=Prosthecobacter dejongeii TaxID=48465 RepID=A0A7W7YJL7_9BACT|nr:2OG-Fe(II) oxygenase [Prosthecobacter dejongeii]MBB5037435.1 PKHD-type hydroxylase [Prosthecobacter dejongeii]